MKITNRVALPNQAALISRTKKGAKAPSHLLRLAACKINYRILRDLHIALCSRSCVCPLPLP